MKTLLYFLFVIQLLCVALESTLLYYNPDSTLIQICFAIAVACAAYTVLQINRIRKNNAFISGDY